MKRRGPDRKANRRHHRMLEVLALFRIVFKSIREHYSAVERRAGISGAQLWALSQVASGPGIKVGELARRLAIHQSTASNLLDRLTREGLVRRARGQGDQRVARLFVTASGAAVLRRAPSPVRAMLLEALYSMPESSLERLGVLLGELLGHMNVDRTASGKPLSD